MYGKNIYSEVSKEKEKAITTFNEGYKDFISYAKTERLATEKAVELARAKGFKDFSEVQSLQAGDRVYFVNRKRTWHYMLSERSR